MYPWNNLSTLLLTAGTKALESTLDQLSEETLAQLADQYGSAKVNELVLGIYQALEKLYSSSTAFRDVLMQWVQVIPKMADHQLAYAPKSAQEQLFAAIVGVEEALCALVESVQQTGVLSLRFRGTSQYSRERLEGRLMDILAPAQYHIEMTSPQAARTLYVTRLNHIVALEETNIQRMEEIGRRLAEILNGA